MNQVRKALPEADLSPEGQAALAQELAADRLGLTPEQMERPLEDDERQRLVQVAADAAQASVPTTPES